MIESQVMSVDTLLVFLALVMFGAAVQTITGFAIGLMIVAGIAALNLVDIAFGAAVISLISLLNTIIALRSTYKLVDWQKVGLISAGLMPLLISGVWILELLSDEFYWVLRRLLGVVIVAAGVMLMVTPKPFAQTSSRLAFVSCGAIGGVIAGLYSAGGAPLAYFMYRQPESVQVIRASLLAIFFVSTFWRAMVVGVAGHINLEVLTTTLMAIPVVVITTVATTR